jgi:SOS response regulatory protein OraA/RecX
LKRIPNPGESRLVALTASGENGVRLTLIPEVGERISFVISKEAYDKLGAPKKGATLTEAQVAALVGAANLRGALRHAANILGYGDNSERTLTQKLRAMGYQGEEIAYAIDRVKTLGLMDEMDGAVRRAESAARKGWSRRKVYAYLISRGYSSETAKAAIAEGERSGEIDFAENRRRFMEDKQEKGLDPNEIRAALYRAGF